MGKVTIEDMSDFIKLVIKRDLDELVLPIQQLSYLKLISDYIIEVGDIIIAEKDARDKSSPIGEDRPEISPEDVEINVLQGDKAIEFLTNILYGKDSGVLSPIKFLRSSQCLRGIDAHKWLYERKYISEHDHIHVYEYDLCLVLPENRKEDVAWVEPDGVKVRGDLPLVTFEIYEEYLRRHTATRSKK